MHRLFQQSIAAAALLTGLSAPLGFAQNAQTLSPRADPLLSVDLNRTEIVGRLITQWQADVTAPQRDSFKQKLAGLRADRLLAVSLVGSFDGVLHVLYGQEKADLSAVNRAALGVLSGSARDSQKALGDANIDLVYTPLTPCRLFDTRTGQSSALGTIGGIFAPNTRRTVSPAGACGVPASGVKSLVMGVTTHNSTTASGGYIAVVAPGAGISATVDIFNLGSEWSATNIIAPTSGSGQFDVFVNTATVDVIVDVVGYFAPPPQPIGDITEVNTGTATTTGLTGGVTSGIATLALAPSFKLPQACAPNQIAKWNGSAWICAADDAGPANAFVQGGNSFGAPGVIGTTDAQPLTVKSGGTDINVVNFRGDGMRVTSALTATNTINGHFDNVLNAGVYGATVGGGGYSFGPHRISGNFGTVSGGVANTSGERAVVSGGDTNSAVGKGSVISGGANNYIALSGAFATVLGGELNSASGFNSVISGGYNNVIGAGPYSSILGGLSNAASGYASVVAGGIGNVASGAESFAAGSSAEADRTGTFVWSDNSTGARFTASKNWQAPAGQNTFNVRATGGVMFATTVNTTTGVPTTFCYMGVNGTGWNCASDRNVKERVEPIKPSRVLAGVLAMPVSTWSIIGSKFRQMGPMAQDFYRAFGLGDSEKAINSIDASGVAFAAIQGLNERLVALVKVKDAENAKLKARLAAIEKKLGM